MVTLLIIASILFVLFVGFFQIFNKHLNIAKKRNFSEEYRNKFLEFSNRYFETYNRWTRSGKFDGDQYMWLTMNVSKIQDYVGNFGVMTYRPAFENYLINKYQIIINTIPKFREGRVHSSEVGAVDDCLLRFIGYLEEIRLETLKHLKNPIIWFREGFREILSIPILILSWFGIISNRTVDYIKNSLVYKVFAGLTAMVTFISCIVTIIVGYDQTLKFISEILTE
jgi:hypothetical protein